MKAVPMVLRDPVRIPVAIPATDEVGSGRGVAGDVDGVGAVEAAHGVGAFAAEDGVARGPPGDVLDERLGRPSQVTLFVPSVAVPVARLIVRGVVTTLIPQPKQRPSLSLRGKASPSPVIWSCPQPCSKP